MGNAILQFCVTWAHNIIGLSLIAIGIICLWGLKEWRDNTEKDFEPHRRYFDTLDERIAKHREGGE